MTEFELELDEEDGEKAVAIGGRGGLSEAPVRLDKFGTGVTDNTEGGGLVGVFVVGAVSAGDAGRDDAADSGAGLTSLRGLVGTTGMGMGACCANSLTILDAARKTALASAVSWLLGSSSRCSVSSSLAASRAALSSRWRWSRS